MDCKDCKNKQLCKDLMAEGFEDFTCHDLEIVAMVMEANDIDKPEEEEQ